MGFEYWASQAGIQRADGIKLKQEGKDERNIYAATSQDIATGTPVLYVPEHLILSSNKAIAELRTAEMAEAEQYLSSENQYRDFYLMLKILAEYQKGENSPWYQWLNSLPRYFSNAVSMTSFCLTCLPPLMKHLAEEEREAQQLLSFDPIKHVPFLTVDVKSGHPRDVIKWAYQIVSTRAVETADGDLRIVPMADFFNHGSDYAEVEPSYDEAGNYYAYTTYDVPAGSPLRFIYADPRNPSHLLARYGFFDEMCPATYCKLLPPAVNEEMIELGYSYYKMLFYRTGEVADEVWDIFLYTYLGSVNVDDQQTLMRAHRSGDSDTKLALHDKHYSATSAALLEHVDLFIEDIDKLLKKAETIGVSDPRSIYIRNEHPRLPLVHSHNVFVRQTFQNVRDRYSTNPDSWKDATKVLVQECDDTECAIAECLQIGEDNWSCEGGLGPNADGSDRLKSQTVIA